MRRAGKKKIERATRENEERGLEAGMNGETPEGMRTEFVYRRKEERKRRSGDGREGKRSGGKRSGVETERMRNGGESNRIGGAKRRHAATWRIQSGGTEHGRSENRDVGERQSPGTGPPRGR